MIQFVQCACFLQVNDFFQDSTFDIEAFKHEFETAMRQNVGESSILDFEDIECSKLNAIEIDGIEGILAIVLDKTGHLRQSV